MASKSYRRGFFAAKRTMIKMIRLHFYHLRPLDQIDMKRFFKKVKP